MKHYSKNFKSKAIAEKNGGFCTKSKEEFAVDSVDNLAKYEARLIFMLADEMTSETPPKSKLMAEVILIEKFRKNIEFKISQQEPDYEEITVNSFNKMAAGV